MPKTVTKNYCRSHSKYAAWLGRDLAAEGRDLGADGLDLDGNTQCRRFVVW